MNGVAMQLAKKVSQRNPGADTVVRTLMWFTEWDSMMEWLLKEGYVGPELWRLYKDEFRQDWSALGRWIEAQMARKKITPNFTS